MSTVELPRGLDGQPVLPAEVWDATPVAAQGLIVALVAGLAGVAALRAEVHELRAQLRQHSGNSSRPPSSDPPQAPRRSPAPVAAVRTTLRAARVVNAHETRWPQAGRTQWLWVVVGRLVTVFTISASRGSQVIKELLGEDYTGVVGSDRYSGYAWLDTTWHQFRDGHLDRAGLVTQMQPVQDAFDALLDTGIACGDARAAGLCRALDRLWPALWTFVDEEGVEPTNNAAERALRPALAPGYRVAGTPSRLTLTSP